MNPTSPSATSTGQSHEATVKAAGSPHAAVAERPNRVVQICNVVKMIVLLLVYISTGILRLVLATGPPPPGVAEHLKSDNFDDMFVRGSVYEGARCRPLSLASTVAGQLSHAKTATLGSTGPVPKFHPHRPHPKKLATDEDIFRQFRPIQKTVRVVPKSKGDEVLVPGPPPPGVAEHLKSDNFGDMSVRGFVVLAPGSPAPAVAELPEDC